MKSKLVKSLLNALNIAVSDDDEQEDDLSPVKFGYSPEDGEAIAKSLDDEKHLVTAIVLRPDVPDLQGDIYSPEAVEDACYSFGIYCQEGNIDHEEMEDSIRFPESYIAQTDFPLGEGVVRKGDWVMTMYVPDQDQWKAVKDGTFTGFSVYCNAIATAEQN